MTNFSTVISFQTVKIEDFLRQAATDIITILTDPSLTTTPCLQVDNPIRNKLLQSATLLQRV